MFSIEPTAQWTRLSFNEYFCFKYRKKHYVHDDYCLFHLLTNGVLTGYN